MSEISCLALVLKTISFHPLLLIGWEHSPAKSSAVQNVCWCFTALVLEWQC